MQSGKIIFCIIFLFGTFFGTAQIQIEEAGTILDTTYYKPIDALAPAKAAFFSAILPGLGQAYNKKYWKIPIVYGGLAATFYFYNDSNQLYKEFRSIYKRRLEGYTDDKYKDIYSNEVIINGQRTYQRNRDISMMLLIGVYVLNIIDANVDAHLLQFNVSEKLSIKPDFYINDLNNKQNIGLVLNYSF